LTIVKAPVASLFAGKVIARSAALISAPPTIDAPAMPWPVASTTRPRFQPAMRRRLARAVALECPGGQLLASVVEPPRHARRKSSCSTPSSTARPCPTNRVRFTQAA